MNLRGVARRIDAAKGKSFLEQSKTAAKIGQRMNFTRCTEPVENPRVSFSFDTLQKCTQRACHFLAIHASIFGIRPEVALSVLTVHLCERLSGGGLDIGEG